ncbi:MAG TPA: GNAT family N-acetyltransferase [Geothrix sp.]|nr:GNAT family N-acetyltransferase [Geothrix sp.]
MSEVTLRSLAVQDLDCVAAIESRIAGHPRRGFLEKRFAAAAADPNAFLSCGATGPAGLAGYAIARIQTGEFAAREAVAVLDVIGVAPDAQGQGLGKALLDHMEAQLKARDIPWLKTQVAWADPAMVQFFAASGFRLSSTLVLERDTSPLAEQVGEFRSDRRRDREDASDLSRDRVLVRSLGEADLAEVVRIDHKLTGRDRAAYFAAKFREMLTGSGIRVSLVAEEKGVLTGYLMARVDFGEFGQVEATAVIDTIGVHPDFAGFGIGHALLSQLLLNLSTLQVERVQTQLTPEDFSLNRFLRACGFQQSQRLVLVKTLAL